MKKIIEWFKNPQINIWEVFICCNNEPIGISEYFLTYRKACKYMEQWNKENNDKEYSASLGGEPLYL